MLGKVNVKFEKFTLDLNLHRYIHIYMWHLADHLAIRVAPALGFAAFLGNFMLTCFRCTASKAHHLFLDVTLSTVP